MQLALSRWTRSLQPNTTRHLAMQISGRMSSNPGRTHGSFWPISRNVSSFDHPRSLSVKAPNDIWPVDAWTDKPEQPPAAEHPNGDTSEDSDIFSPDEQDAAFLPLRRREIKFAGTPRTSFRRSTVWLLRHAARDLGYEVTPDGFVRVSDVLSFQYFNKYTPQSFADAIYQDPRNRFEMVFLPDLVDGALREVWWVRARDGHSIPGVDAKSKRILNMGKLKAIVYLASPAEWNFISKYGIPARKNCVVPVYRPGEGTFPRRRIPDHKEYVCITIDAEKAVQLGVKFFHDNLVNVMAVGNHDEVIPVAAFRSAIQLELTIENLK